MRLLETKVSMLPLGKLISFFSPTVSVCFVSLHSFLMLSATLCCGVPVPCFKNGLETKWVCRWHKMHVYINLKSVCRTWIAIWSFWRVSTIASIWDWRKSSQSSALILQSDVSLCSENTAVQCVPPSPSFRMHPSEVRPCSHRRHSDEGGSSHPQEVKQLLSLLERDNFSFSFTVLCLSGITESFTNTVCLWHTGWLREDWRWLGPREEWVH